MCWLKTVMMGWILVSSGTAIAAALDTTSERGDLAMSNDAYDASQYAVYEGAGQASPGCKELYIVPRSSWLILASDLPTPLRFAPQISGFKAELCGDGRTTGIERVDLTADDMLARGALLSDYNLSHGDFNNDGMRDFLLRGRGARSGAAMMTVDRSGNPVLVRHFEEQYASESALPEAPLDTARDDPAIAKTFGPTSTVIEANALSAATTNVASAFNVDLVGTIAGRFRVDESGAATYSVDIFAAPGTAGVQPRISLEYSSNAADGVAGPGWSIGGVSEITRCRQTVAQDNNSTGIELGASDRFCLDGQRLILTSGVYGAEGSTYRTEIDSYAVVTIVNSWSSPVGHPRGFKVARKDGSISHYGAYYLNIGIDSQHTVLGSKVLSWSIAHFADTVGNAIRFSYSNIAFGNQHLVSRIDYAYGSDPGTTNASSTFLQFNYEQRPDPSSGYVAGAGIARLQRLQSIKSFSSGAEVRSYNLVYRSPDPLGAQSFLEKLFECVGNRCLSPTTFNWKRNLPGFKAGVDAGWIAGGRLSTLRVMDINGDGRSDFIYRSMNEPYPLSYRLSTVTNFGPGRLLIPSSTKTLNVDDLAVTVLDMNLDGHQDLLYQVIGTGTFPTTFFQGTRTGFLPGVSWGSPTFRAFVAADITGDGLSDLNGYSYVFPMYQAAQRVEQGGNWTTVFSAAQALSGSNDVPKPVGCPTTAAWFLPAGLMSDGADFNGDGRVDFPASLKYSSGTSCSAEFAGAAISSGNGHFATRGWVAGTALPAADMNADGLADHWHKDGAGNRTLRFSTGTGFAHPLVVGSGADLDVMEYIDYNADGYLDLLYPSSAQAVMLIRLFDPATNSYRIPGSTGLPYQAKSASVAADRYLPLDVDGDGHTDLLRISNSVSGNSLTLYRSINTGGGNRIVGIDNGLGKSTGIVYKSLTDASVYKKGDNATNARLWPGGPVLDVLAPSYVVASVSSTNPTAHPVTPGAVNRGATHTTGYLYADLKLQAWGRGPLGFALIKITDEQTGITTGTQYRQDFPFTGRPAWEIATKNNVVISSVAHSYAQIARRGSDATSYWQVHHNKREDQRNDPLSGDELSYVVTENAIPDAWGNVPATTVSTFAAGQRAAPLTQIITASNYDSAEDRRHGCASSTLVTYKRGGAPDIVRGTAFSYYPAGQRHGGLVSMERVSDAHNQLWLSTSYEYDNFGNVTRTTYSTTGQPNRYIKTSYDGTGRFLMNRRGEFMSASGTWSEKIIESITSRNSLGQPLTEEHINGLITTRRYDVLGREIFRGDNTGVALTREYLPGDRFGAAYRVAETMGSGSARVEYFDVLGRNTVKAHKGFDGRWVYSETEYDNVGRVRRHSTPHFEGDAVYWTTNTYDAFRMLSQFAPATGGAMAPTRFGYSGLTTSITNALGQLRTESRNAAGELVAVVDHLGGELRYTYDSAGEVTSVMRNGRQNGRSVSIDTRFAYDGLGRRTQMIDPDKGTSFYSYNGFGELTDQYRVVSTSSYTGTLSAAQASAVPMRRTQLAYDRRGRTVKRTDFRENGAVESVAVWDYDTADNGIGLLAGDSIEGMMIGHVYGYDRYGRNFARLDVNDAWYVEETTYDAHGRVSTRTDAVGSGSGTRYEYNPHGYLQSIADLATRTSLYRVLAMDALGNVASASTGNGAAVRWGHDPRSGLLSNHTATIAGAALQDLSYTWDALGNLTGRRDGSLLMPGLVAKNQRQQFCYDGLNRLIKTHQGNSNGSCSLAISQQDQEYDSFGNIVRKSGVGTYQYNDNKPHQLQGTSDGTHYTYDVLGNLIADSSGRSLVYSVFEKPVSISKGSDRIEFGYGVDRELLKRADSGPTGTSKTFFIGNVEKVVKADGSYLMRRHLAGAAIWTHHFTREHVETRVDRHSVHEDLLGSMVLLTGDDGSVKQQFAYDPWGRRVWPNNGSTPLAGNAFLPVSSQATSRGFTGHEMLDSMGLVHMQGRIYDQRLGRFVQADPFVQMPDFMQSHNRYAYVFNAPLKFTDPSGFNGAGDDMNTWANGLGRSGLDFAFDSVVVQATALYSNPSAYMASINMGGGVVGAYAGFSFSSPALQSLTGVSRQSTAGKGTDLERMHWRQPDKGGESSRMTGVARQGVSSTEVHGKGENARSPQEVIVNAKQLNDQRTGFVTYGSRDVQWGTPETIRSLQALGERWNARHPTGPRIQIGNISRRDGEAYDKHRSHRTGKDVDIRPMRNDGLLRRTNIHAESYSSDLTQDLIDVIRMDPTVKMILFNDPLVNGVQPWSKHDDHLHIRFEN